MDLVTAFQAAVMGLVEGLTEFIPVSSTGHLIALGDLMGFLPNDADKEFRDLFEVVIQLAAILAVCVHFRARILAVVGNLHRDPAARAFVCKLLLAFVPAGVVGLAAHHFVETHLMNAGVVAATLAIGGLAILLIERRQRTPTITGDAQTLPLTTMVLIGCCQCLAILLPGTSRAGATIMGALLLGVDRRTATDFSFFLAIPTMFAASGYSLLKHHHALHGDGRFGVLAIGFVVAFAVAWAVVAWLLRFVATHTFVVFGWYRIAAGLALAALCVAGLVTVKG